MRLKEAQVIEGLYTLEGTPREWGIPTLYSYPPCQRGAEWEEVRQYTIVFPYSPQERFDDFNECLKTIVEVGPIACVDIIDDLLQEVSAEVMKQALGYRISQRILEIDPIIERVCPDGVYSGIGDLIGDFS